MCKALFGKIPNPKDKLHKMLPPGNVHNYMTRKTIPIAQDPNLKIQKFISAICPL